MERKRLYPTLEEYEQYKKQLRAFNIGEHELSSGKKTTKKKASSDINEMATSIVRRTTTEEKV